MAEVAQTSVRNDGFTWIYNAFNGKCNFTDSSEVRFYEVLECSVMHSFAVPHPSDDCGTY